MILQANCSDYLHAYALRSSVARGDLTVVREEHADVIYEEAFTNPYDELDSLLKNSVVVRADLIDFKPLNWEFNSFWGVYWQFVPEYPPLYASRRILPIVERYVNHLVERARLAARNESIVQFYETYAKLYGWLSSNTSIDGAGLFTEFTSDGTWPSREKPRRAALVIVKDGRVERYDFTFNSFRDLYSKVTMLLNRISALLDTGQSVHPKRSTSLPTPA